MPATILGQSYGFPSRNDRERDSCTGAAVRGPRYGRWGSLPYFHRTSMKLESPHARSQRSDNTHTCQCPGSLSFFGGCRRPSLYGATFSSATHGSGHFRPAFNAHAAERERSTLRLAPLQPIDYDLVVQTFISNALGEKSNELPRCTVFAVTASSYSSDVMVHGNRVRFVL